MGPADNGGCCCGAGAGAGAGARFGRLPAVELLSDGLERLGVAAERSGRSGGV